MMEKVSMQALNTAYAMAHQAEVATGAEDAGVCVAVTTEHPGIKYVITVRGSKVGSPMLASETTLETLTEKTAEAVRRAWETV